jgi:hypothetical protein
MVSLPMTNIRRSDSYDREPATTAAYFVRCRRDFAEARARGWTSLDYATICEPELPMGYPPADHPRRAEADAIQRGGGAITLPDYGYGEDGGYLATGTSNG